MLLFPLLLLFVIVSVIAIVVVNSKACHTSLHLYKATNDNKQILWSHITMNKSFLSCKMYTVSLKQEEIQAFLLKH